MRWRLAKTMDEVAAALQDGLRVERTMFFSNDLNVPPSDQPGSQGWLRIRELNGAHQAGPAKWRIGTPEPEHYGDW